MTTVYKCDYCMTLYEGLEIDDCPKCLQHFSHLVARYPSFSDEEIHDENEKDPKYIR